MVLLGIDPGFTITGFGVMKKEKGKISLLDYGMLRLPVDKPLEVRIALFHDFIKSKIIQHNVEVLVLETPFYGKNLQSFLKLGYLRGILYLLSTQHSLLLHEFAPAEIKSSITGYGRAQKDQVARVLLRLLPGLQMPSKFDITDALAVTLCGAWKVTSVRPEVLKTVSLTR